MLKGQLLFTVIMLIIGISSCVYDPPKKGKTIRICNQTDEQIVATWNLDKYSLRMYDTVLVNSNLFIRRSPGFIAEFETFEDFIPENQLELKAESNSTIKYYFIKKEFLDKSIQQIMDSSWYSSIEIHPDSIKNNQLNCIMYSKKSILFEHEFNMEYIRNK